ncbi:Fic family protein [Dysgonomonas mossii]|uniref:Fic family protein n=1 Tax=Dysgonomonas mossii TaxID=163665 RepID=UPI0039944D58
MGIIKNRKDHLSDMLLQVEKLKLEVDSLRPKNYNFEINDHRGMIDIETSKNDRGVFNISEDMIKDYHRQCSGFQIYDIKNPGQYRTTDIAISGKDSCPLPEAYKIPSLVNSFIANYNDKLKKGVHPLICAAYLHFGLVFIHPFNDGNGRTSRFLMNMCLIKNGFAPISPLKDEKRAYDNAMEKSRSKEDPSYLYLWVAQKELAALMIEKYKYNK